MDVSVGVTKQEDEESLDIRDGETEKILENAQIYVPSLKVRSEAVTQGPVWGTVILHHLCRV